MEKERIEEMKKQLFYQYLQVAGFHKEAEDWVRQALTEAYQAGIDEVAGIINEKKFTGKYKHDGDVYSPNEINAMLDDTIKALQDNKEQ